MSRPEKIIDWSRVDELLACGCQGTEIAEVMGMHPETFYGRVEKEFKIGFSEYAQKKKSIGEALLREVQYKKAVGLSKKGDNTLLIWLGKQRLGQKENAEAPQATAEVMKNYETMIEQMRLLQSSKESGSSSCNINSVSQSCNVMPSE